MQRESVYTIRQAEAVASQLEKFTTAYAHQVVGQFANLDFWLGEVTHALKTIDTYGERFERMAAAQQRWIERHNTRVGDYCPQCEGACELEDGLKKPAKPRKYPSADRDRAIRRVRNATYHFLLRCFRMKLLDATAVRAACDRVGTSVDPADLLST